MKQITPEEIEQASELEYREFPTEVAGSMNHNKDIHCFKKRKAFIKGAEWAISQMQPEPDRRFASLMESVNAVASLYRSKEKTSVELDKYAEAIEYNAKAQALEEIMKEAEKISNAYYTQPPTK